LKPVHLGFEVGTGNSVEIPLRNIAVTGQTQESGKTTTLEALISRAKVPALAFITKRGEKAFSVGHLAAPYFRDRADWQFVASLLDATLQEKNKFLRPWIMKICRHTQTLADVQREVRKALETAKGINEGVYTQLDAYLDLIVPDIKRANLADSMLLRKGLNVMDLTAYSTPMQMLFVQSAIDWILNHETQTVTVIPEAWEFIPEGKGSPVKNSAVALVRKGSGIGNHIWIDSQDMAGVDKTILRGCPVWLIGVQREANEIKRNLANIPAGIKKPSAADIAGLKRGQFYACWGDHAVKTYVQPAWMSTAEAIAIATGVLTASRRPPQQPVHTKEKIVNEVEAQELREENRRLRTENTELHNQLADAKRAPAATSQAVGAVDIDALYQTIKARLVKEAPTLLRVLTDKPELRVTVERRTVEASGDTLRGRIALLIASGFFTAPRAGTAVESELRRQAFACSRPNVYRETDKLANEGFLTKEDGGYLAVEGMKINIVEA
jgi:hypothetical protein